MVGQLRGQIPRRSTPGANPTASRGGSHGRTAPEVNPTHARGHSHGSRSGGQSHASKRSFPRNPEVIPTEVDSGGQSHGLQRRFPRPPESIPTVGRLQRLIPQWRFKEPQVMRGVGSPAPWDLPPLRARHPKETIPTATRYISHGLQRRFPRSAAPGTNPTRPRGQSHAIQRRIPRRSAPGVNPTCSRGRFHGLRGSFPRSDGSRGESHAHKRQIPRPTPRHHCQLRVTAASRAPAAAPRAPPAAPRAPKTYRTRCRLL